MKEQHTRARYWYSEDHNCFTTEAVACGGGGGAATAYQQQITLRRCGILLWFIITIARRPVRPECRTPCRTLTQSDRVTRHGDGGGGGGGGAFTTKGERRTGVPWLSRWRWQIVRNRMSFINCFGNTGRFIGWRICSGGRRRRRRRQQQVYPFVRCRRRLQNNKMAVRFLLFVYTDTHAHTDARARTHTRCRDSQR